MNEIASGTELATAYVQIIPSADGIKAAIEKELDPEFESAGKSGGEKFSSKFLTTAKVALAAGAAALAKVVSSAISEGADLEQSLGGIETLFKDSADTMKEYAYAAYETAGISANDYMEQATSFAASLLSSLDGDTAAAAESANQAIIDMADNANKMGTSIEDIQNAYQGFAKQNYTMLDNLKLGYGGTKTEMERLLSDAEELSGVEYDISNLSDVYEAIHVIQESLDITGTTSKEAATTLSGSFASMKAAASNLLGNMTLGEDIAPQLEQLISTTKTHLTDNLIPAIGNVFSSLPQTVTTLGSAGVEMAATFVSSLSDGISEIPDIANTVLSSLVANISNFANSIDLAGATTGLIDSVLPMLAQLSETIRANAGQLVDVGLDLLLQLAQGIANGLPTLITYIPTIVTNIAGIINDNAPKILATGVKMLKTLANGIIQAIPTLVANIPQIITAIVAVFEAFNWINLGKNIISALKNGIKAMTSTVKNVGKNISESFYNMLKSLPTKLKTLGKNAITKLVNGIKGMLSSAKGAGTTILTGIVNIIKSLPSKLLSLGKNSISDMSGGIKGMLSVAKSAAKSILNGIIGAITSLPSKLLSLGKSAISKLASGIKAMLSVAKSAAKSILSGIVSAITDLPSKLFSIAKNAVTKVKSAFTSGSWSSVGKNIISGIKSGLTSAVSSLASSAASAAKSALSAAKSALGINSPSKVFRDEVGLMMGYGMAEGLENSYKTVQKALNGLADTSVKDIRSKIDVIGEIESSGFLKRSAVATSAAGNITNTTIVNGITYDDGSNITDAVSALMRAARIERRS